MWSPTYLKLVNQYSDDRKHFRLTRIRNVPLVVQEDSLEKRRHHSLVDHLLVISLLDVSSDQLQDLLLDSPETSDLGHLGRDVAISLHSLIDQ